jgi:phospholipase C
VSDQEETEGSTTRRAFMVGGAAAAVGAAAASGAAKPTDAQARLVDKLVARASGAANNASLSDVKHIVILMQENRSFDHYFGTLSGTRGFSDPGVLRGPGGSTVFSQYGYQLGVGVTASGYTQPFNLLNNPPAQNGEATNDISHSWTTQHASWNNGKMDQFMTAHLAADGYSPAVPAGGTGGGT